MSETKPTAAALRAAMYVYADLRNLIPPTLVTLEDKQVLAEIIDRETSLVQLEADSKKLREPATCNAGHKSNLPLALWDCPVCTQLLRDELDRLCPKVGGWRMRWQVRQS